MIESTTTEEATQKAMTKEPKSKDAIRAKRNREKRKLLGKPSASGAKLATKPPTSALPAEPVIAKRGVLASGQKTGRPPSPFAERYPIRHNVTQMAAWSAAARAAGLTLQDWFRNVADVASGRVKGARA